MPVTQKHPLHRQIIAWILVIALSVSLPFSYTVANPENPEVKAGDVEFNFDTPGELFIDQFSDRAIIDWESFSIDSGELTRFIQPSSSSAALSRVFSGSPSEIHGSLQANGQIFLINPNGILVGPNGSIDTAGFLGSTLDVSDAEFMTGGDMTFSGGSSASVINLGTINAINGGDIFLIAKNVVNEGTLNATEGTVGLAAGSEVRVAAAGEERITIAPGGEGSVTNKGQIQAMTAELKAAGGNQYALAINNEGMVRAKSFESRGGRLYLSAGSGRIVNTGQARASKSVTVSNTGVSGSAEIGGVVKAQDEETGNGGVVEIAAPNVEVLAGGRVDASGAEAGQVAIRATVIEGWAKVNGDVRANSDVGAGGIVSVTGETIEVGATGSIRADGATYGGLVTLGVNPLAQSRSNFSLMPEASDQRTEVRSTLITTAAGSRISASGQSGNGGDVLLFADTDNENSEMRLGGEIRANGGGGHGGEVLALGHDVFVEQTAIIKANGETDGGLIRVEGEGDIVVAGRMQAKGTTGDGGFVHVSGENVTFTETSEVDARGGRDGGFVEVQGGEDGTVSIAGQLLASGGRDGGMITVTGGDVIVTQTGLLDASGERDGGFISIDAANNATFNGTALAMGGSGDGGVITITGENVTVGQTGLLDASGGNDGGLITVEAENNVNFNGTARAIGGEGDGGRINVLGENVSLGSTALLDASGAVMGGNINIGGGRNGRDPNLRNARNTTVANGARIVANGGEQGGNVVLWADGTQDFQGSVEAKGSSNFSLIPEASDQRTEVRSTLGGFVEVSGLEHLNFAGHVDTGGGQLLLDPFNYTIGAAEAGAIVAALAGNNVTIDTTQNVGAQGSSGNAADTGIITVNSNLFYDSPNDLTFLAMADLIFNASVQNRNGAGGDINLVAGWDGTTAFDAAAFAAEDVANTTVFGNNMGSIFVGTGNQTQGVAVGSRSGTTNAFGYDVALQGSNVIDEASSQLGFRISNGRGLDGTVLGALPVVDGAITIHTVNDLTATAGNRSDAYAQVGHVGAGTTGRFGSDPTPEGAATSMIEVSAGNDIRFSGGAGQVNSYAQLGQGGNGAFGDHGGTTTITTANDVVFLAGSGERSYAQLGQGGFGSFGRHSGVTTIMNVNDVIFTAGSETNAYAQLGQGGIGAQNGGGHTGTTTIANANNIAFTGGDGNNAYAQLGQGGNGVGGNHNGTITITNVNDITFTGDRGYAQLGHGAGDTYAGFGDYSGAITISGANDIEIARTSVGAAFLGHGGNAAEGTATGTINLESVRDVRVSDGFRRRASIGHVASTTSGDLIIQAARDLQLRAGSGQASKKGVFTSAARVGHTSENGTASGNIKITHGGDLTLDSTTPVNAPGAAQIGHDAATSVSGDVSVQTGGNATLSAEGIIGHATGGAYPDGNTFFGVGEVDGAQTLTAAAGSQLNSAPVANGGELRIYLPGLAGYQLAAGTLLNGTAAPGPGVDPFPNDQGGALFGEGPYAPDLGVGNFGFYTLADPAAAGGGDPLPNPGNGGGTPGNPVIFGPDGGVITLEDLFGENGEPFELGGLFDPGSGILQFIPGGNPMNGPVSPAGLDNEMIEGVQEPGEEDEDEDDEEGQTTIEDGGVNTGE